MQGRRTKEYETHSTNPGKYKHAGRDDGELNDGRIRQGRRRRRHMGVQKEAPHNDW